MANVSGALGLDNIGVDSVTPVLSIDSKAGYSDCDVLECTCRIGCCVTLSDVLVPSLCLAL